MQKITLEKIHHDIVEWSKTKNQIKKRFQNELFDIDSKL